MSGPITEQIRQKGRGKTHKEHKRDIDEPLDKAHLRILIRKEKEVGESQDR